MNPFAWHRQRYIDRQADLLIATIYDLWERYPRLREWPRDEVMMLAAEVRGTPSEIVRLGMRQVQRERVA